ncbi:METTL5 family protein [Caldiplasma sukawensis]
MKIDKKYLEIKIQNLLPIRNRKIELEQYETDPIIASQLLHYAYLDGNIKQRTVLDAGSGNGLFSYGSLLLGAEHVVAIEVDLDQVNVILRNIGEEKSFTLYASDISNLIGRYDTSLCNPPFGSYRKNNDLPLMDKIFETSKYIYFIHNEKAYDFVKKYVSERAEITRFEIEKFVIKNIYPHHKNEKVMIKVLFVSAINSSF